jgi:hypothetical protein
VNDKIWKLAFILPLLLMILAIISILVYILIPSLFSALAGGNAVCVIGPQASGSATTSINSLCNLSETVLAMATMLLIILSAVSFIGLMLLGAIEVVFSERLGVPRKTMWIAAFILFPITIVLYYLIDRKNAV